MKRSVLLLLAVVFSLSFPLKSECVEFPTRPLQIVVPFPAGGAADVVARILAPRLGEHLGKAVTVVNKPGAGAGVGLQFVAGSKPDGYTLVTTPPNLMILEHTVPNIAFSHRDFQPVSLPTSFTNVVVVSSKSQWKTLEDLVDYGKKNPGKLNHGNAGAGAMSTLLADWLADLTGIEITQIPYGGEAPALVAMLGGRIDFSIPNISSTMSYVKSGQVRILAISHPERLKTLPGAPTMTEKGYPDFSFINWHMYMVPANTPKQVVDTLGEAFQKVLREEEVVKALENVGAAVENWGPEKSADLLKKDDEKWSRVIKKVAGKTK
ncbi:MAG: tripartite tricarboxylate transporter substrate binding protein [Thermodesulfobacteriota bacterium]